jgi:hypothetical protein
MQIRSLADALSTLALALSTVCPASAAPANQLSPEEKTAGWTLLFDGQTTRGWHSFKKETFPEKCWAIEDGCLHCLGKPGGDIVSDAQLDQFELQWEWKLATNGNSGVKYFVTDSRNEALGHEYQMIDDVRELDAVKGEGKRLTASFYDVLKPAVKTPVNPPSEVNRSRIVVRNIHVEHWLNGVKVLEYECGSEATKAAVAKSKFKNTAGFGERVKGHILLQDHNSQVWFRNVKIRELPQP